MAHFGQVANGGEVGHENINGGVGAARQVVEATDLIALLVCQYSSAELLSDLSAEATIVITLFPRLTRQGSADSSIAYAGLVATIRLRSFRFVSFTFSAFSSLNQDGLCFAVGDARQ